MVVPRKRLSQDKRTLRRTTVAYGWIPDVPDHRDYQYAPPRRLLRALPLRVDLRQHCPPVYQQGRLHSCTAHAIAAAIEFDQIKESRSRRFMPSRLFIYYNERAIERSINSDSGAQIRTGIKAVAKRGVCGEHLWRYHPAQFREKPRPRCYRDAKRHPAVTYHRVQRALANLKACLASGHPFVFGFTVYESFHSEKVKRTGRASMPRPHEKMHGGHAVLAVGYDEHEGRVIARNSWGKKWGMAGYFTLPFEYFTNHHLSADFWTLRIEE
ncbi:MAG: C1 family peptidase [Verrucomicrobia bacterium]|nr:C1 family peptidase [Verrucomicrobiota bacterium]